MVNASDFFPAPVNFFNPPGSADPADDTAINNFNIRSPRPARHGQPVTAPYDYVNSTRM